MTALVDLAAQTEVFARTSPEHKLRIVRALQARGAVVAMTGDGVNDAPALKQADVGIAMGRKGTEAAKEASEMVLLDDHFASIVAAVHEGRTVYDNIRKVIAWTLPTNGGEVLIVIVAILFGFTMPMTAAQILWINLITTVTLGLVLAFEPSEPGVMRRPPRPAGAPLLSRFLLWRVCLVSALFGAGALADLLLRAGARPRRRAGAHRGRQRSSWCSESSICSTSATCTSPRSRCAARWARRRCLLALAVVIAAQLAFTYAPFMHALFETRPVQIAEGIVIIAAGILLMLVLEVEKIVLRRFGAFQGMTGVTVVV